VGPLLIWPSTPAGRAFNHLGELPPESIGSSGRSIGNSIAALDVQDAIIDGEIVVLGSRFWSRFLAAKSVLIVVVFKLT
jgi:hypothetical protein